MLTCFEHTFLLCQKIDRDDLLICPKNLANQELKFLAQSLSQLKLTERFIEIVFNPFQRVLALSQELEFLVDWAFSNPSLNFTISSIRMLELFEIF